MVTQMKSAGVMVRNQQIGLHWGVSVPGFNGQRDHPTGPEVRWIELGNEAETKERPT